MSRQTLTNTSCYGRWTPSAYQSTSRAEGSSLSVTCTALLRLSSTPDSRVAFCS